MSNTASRRVGAHLLVALAMTGLMTSTAGQAERTLPVEPALAQISDTIEQAVAAEAVTENAAPEASHVGDGIASYYGKELAGNRTASGERFNPAALTAAHRTLPLGSKLRVTNKANGKSVVVRINDRGPFHKSRLLDVSLAAARDIGMIGAGKAAVRLELLH
jgi:rare lipoprotein A